jgi:hypothetical protein
MYLSDMCSLSRNCMPKDLLGKEGELAASGRRVFSVIQYTRYNKYNKILAIRPEQRRPLNPHSVKISEKII